MGLCSRMRFLTLRPQRSDNSVVWLAAMTWTLGCDTKHAHEQPIDLASSNPLEPINQ